MTAADLAAMDSGLQVVMPQLHEKEDDDKALTHTNDDSTDSTINAKKDDSEQTQIIDQQQSHKKCSVESSSLGDNISSRLEKSLVLYKDDKILLAAHLLHGIDEQHLQPDHLEIIRAAETLKSLLKDNTTSLDENNDGGWVRQGQHSGRHNFTIDYKLEGQELSCRLETVVHSDLLVPILSVLNESELYAAWLPNYNVPRMRVIRSEKWRQSGRCSQVVNVETEVPWPLAARQVILKAVACDNIDSYAEVENASSSNDCVGREGGRIIIRLDSLDCHNNREEGLDIPSVKNGTVRMKVQGGFTIEKCPTDHPSVKDSMQYDAKTAKNGSESTTTTTSNDLVLVTFSFCVDPQLAVVPKSFINFFVRTAMGQMWNMFLNVAEEVKEGKRPEHSEAIERKQELYKWIEERTRVMLGQASSSSSTQLEGLDS